MVEALKFVGASMGTSNFDNNPPPPSSFSLAEPCLPMAMIHPFPVDSEMLSKWHGKHHEKMLGCESKHTSGNERAVNLGSICLLP
ncbi:hypothetical protein HN51_005472 [Arachis hypogaea]